MTIVEGKFPPGAPCWVDLLSSDLERARQFYGELFGWTFDVSGAEYGGYTTCRAGGHRVAGFAPQVNQGMPDVWSTYFATDDIDRAIGSATAAGASVIAGPMVVGEMGSMAALQDTSGGVFSLWQAGSHTGFGKFGEPNAVAWDEYHSKDFAASIAFYPKVFGWELEVTSDTDDFRYRTATLAGVPDPVAGIMDSASFLPAEVPSHWLVYFNVNDVDAAVAKLVELGGSVLRGAEDTPFGRLASVSDSAGVNFNLHSSNLAASEPPS